VAIGHITGQPYADVIAERIFQPLGMHHSAAAITNDIRLEMVHGHDAPYDDRPWLPEHGLAPAAWVESSEADGCISTSLEDFATYARMLLNRGEGVLDPASFELMTTAHSHDHEDDDEYGYGLALTGTRYGHGGGVIGMHTKLWAEPETGVAVVAAVNGLDGSSELAEAALAVARGERPTPFALGELPEPLTDDGSAEPRLAALCGVYRSHNPWQTCIRVAAREGGLVLGWDGGYSERYPLTEVEPGSFRFGEEWSPERLSFDTEIDGRPQRALLSGGALYRRFSP
jgi:CubicO group peptidase (beta-lactamase class C family)